ncbi:MAG: succinylglutamate desuccinylase/aspartoacylase family protein [Deltaproteobacteria bacterium]
MDEFKIDGRSIGPGERASIQLPVARLKTQTEISMPVRVVRGKKDGPTLFVSAAVHGDEINGVEIIRRLLRLQLLRRIRGTLIAVPMVNVFGFIQLSRYLPDRRDLNRSFPGSEGGSLAARIADMFMSEIVAQSTHGIDLHTGAIHRTNLPQIRVSFDDSEALKLARAFGAPVVMDASLRDGSLREAVCGKGIPVILYEAGEALRFDEWAIRPGLRGIVSIMHEIGMLPAPKRPRKHAPSMLVERSTWVRATESGILSARVTLGQRVHRGDLLGMIGDPFGDLEIPIEAPVSGVVIGRTNLPLLNEGDAVFHIARIDDKEQLPPTMEAFQAALETGFGFDPEGKQE